MLGSAFKIVKRMFYIGIDLPAMLNFYSIGIACHFDQILDFSTCFGISARNVQYILYIDTGIQFKISERMRRERGQQEGLWKGLIWAPQVA